MEKKAPRKIPSLEILSCVRFLRAARKRAGDLEAASQGHPPRDLYSFEFSGDLPGELVWAARRIRNAEEYLAQHGWKMDDTGKVSRIRKGRGADLLGECVWEIYTENYRKEYINATKAKKLLIRRKIAAGLAPFDAEDLSPESGAPIYTAIRNRENRGR